MMKDIFGRSLADLRISVTDRCNFRCSYCMPLELYGEKYKFLPNEQILTFTEIVKIATIFSQMGVNKIRLTGGEPLLRKNLPELIKLLAKIDGIEDLTLTTNGYLLYNQAKALKDAGLKRITVSLDSLDNLTSKNMNGRANTTKIILDGIKQAEKVGFHPIKINTVVKNGVNDTSVIEIAKHFKDSGHIVRFIEYMDVGNVNKWEMRDVVPSEKIVERINSALPIQATRKNHPSEVASRYKYTDGSGEIGTISSITKPFCGDCSRIRLSPDGILYTCLFSNVGNNLKTLLRNNTSDEELRQFIAKVWQNRTDRYSEERSSMPYNQSNKVEMYQIGG